MRVEHQPENLGHAVIVPEHDCGRPRACHRHGGGEGRARRASGADAGQYAAAQLGIDWLGTPAAEGPYRPLAQRRHLQRPACRGRRRRDVSSRRPPPRHWSRSPMTKPPAIADLDDPKAGDGIPIDAMTKEWGDAEAALRGRARPHRARLPHAARIPGADRAARADRALGRRPADRSGSRASGSTAWRAPMPNGSACRSRMCAWSRPTSAAASAPRRSPMPTARSRRLRRKCWRGR